MKQWLLYGIIVGGFTSSVWAQAIATTNFNSGFLNGGSVPDGNLTGWSDTRELPTFALGTDEILDVNVFLHLSGNYNGDLYGYLYHDGGFAVLLNRVGRDNGSPFGYSDGGMNLEFDDTGTHGNIHLYQQAPGFTLSMISDGSSWAPDGRSANPATVMPSDTPDSLLDDFNGLSANGGWTLFLADLSVGETSTVVSWGLQVTTAPEPSTWALLGLGLLLGGARLLQSRLSPS
jgi:subtilisin-like proprotein convertase family protein